MCSVGDNKKTFESIQQRLSEKIITLTVTQFLVSYLVKI